MKTYSERSAGRHLPTARPAHSAAGEVAGEMPVNRLQEQLAGVHITQLLLPPPALGQLVQEKSVHEPSDLQEVAGIAGNNMAVQGDVGLKSTICLNSNQIKQT